MNRRRQRGFNLVELMVGMIISLIVVGGAIYVFMGNAESNIFQMRSTRFVQQMRDVMGRMVNDIRRAGYRGYRHYALTSTLDVANPFDFDTFDNGTITFSPDPAVLSMGIKTSLNIGARTGEAANSCITYAYNLDDDYPALVGVGTSSLPGAAFDTGGNELFGFQLRTSGGVGAVWMRTGGGGAAFDCDSGTWVQVTDPDLVAVDSLDFSVNNSECRNMTDSGRSDCYGTATPGDATDDAIAGDLLVMVREVTITLNGHAVDESDLTYELSQVVDLPNNRVIEVR